jgi:hypothetical protein
VRDSSATHVLLGLHEDFISKTTNFTVGARI